MKIPFLLFIFIVGSLNAQPPTAQHINPATGNPIDPTKTPVKDNLGTPTAQRVNPATGNPIDPTKTVPRDNLGTPTTQRVNPATGNPIDPTKTVPRDNLGTPTTQRVNPATGNPIDPTKTVPRDNLGTPTTQRVNPATGNPVDPTKTVPRDNLATPTTQRVNPATGNPIDPTKEQETRIATTPPTFAGTITEFGPARFVVRSQTGTEPATYITTKETKYEDENGAPLSMEEVKSGIAVTVYYTKNGDQTIASKVVLHRAAPRREVVVVEKRTVRGGEEETGIVGEFVSGEFTVEVDDSRAPRKYNCNASTIYLNETGAPVAADTIRAGVPVTVQYSNEGQKRIATKVIVHKDKPVRAVTLKEKGAEDLAKEDAEKFLKKEEERRKEKLEK